MAYFFYILGPSLSMPDQIRENCQEEAYSMVNKYNGAESPADKSPGEAAGQQDKADTLVISEQDDETDKQVQSYLQIVFTSGSKV